MGITGDGADGDHQQDDDDKRDNFEKAMLFHGLVFLSRNQGNE